MATYRDLYNRFGMEEYFPDPELQEGIKTLRAQRNERVRRTKAMVTRGYNYPTKKRKTSSSPGSPESPAGG